MKKFLYRGNTHTVSPAFRLNRESRNWAQRKIEPNEGKTRNGEYFTNKVVLLIEHCTGCKIMNQKDEMTWRDLILASRILLLILMQML